MIQLIPQFHQYQNETLRRLAIFNIEQPAPVLLPKAARLITMSDLDIRLRPWS
ncbi:hypothetical protein CgS9114_07310 [Corynebacterium glutamicum S9114]|nr:hypothetical protein CgS9114_07310 [Corynebacterium glutamicum S9114]